MQPFQPVVIGAPRSGFALLCSVLAHLQPLGMPKADLGQCLLDLMVARLGAHVAEAIVAAFEAAGRGGDLVFNGNFRLLTGGPRWAGPDRPGQSCYRKYVGARGSGDFLLVVAHPLAVLDSDPVVHSHSDPDWWPRQPAFAGYSLHASIRHPAGIVNSACFSLNALASEHIQRFLPAGTDEEPLRQELALYKLSDPAVFDGIVRHYVDYFAKFLPVRDRYAATRWEDLLLDPVPTIQRVAEAAGFPIPAAYAEDIWRRLDHRNLTGDHRHNYRRDKGIVGDWRNWLTNRHLARMREAGLEACAQALGYGPFPVLDEAAYTPFQRRLDGLLAKGEVHRAAVDDDLFGYAFNKSNIDASAFGFRSYPWREATRIERSTFTDGALQAAAWDAAEAAALRLNRLFDDLIAGDWRSEAAARATLDRLEAGHAGALGAYLPARYVAAFDAGRALVAETFAAGGRPPDKRPPLLLYSVGPYNLVAHAGRFVALPRALGPIDLEREDPLGRPGVAAAASLRALAENLPDMLDPSA